MRWFSRDAIYVDDRGVRRPWFLRQLYMFSVLACAILPVAAVAAAFDAGNFEINGSPMSGHEFIRRGGVVGLFVAVVAFATIARLLRDPSGRARQVLFWGFVGLLLLVVLLGARPDATELMISGAEIALLWWYLYLKSTTREYFGEKPLSS